MKIKAIDIFGATALAALVGVAIAGAVKRKRESEGKVKQIIQGVGATKKFYVYAGYYELYISTKPMPAPYVLQRTCRTIENAIKYADSFGDNIVYCDNVKYDLPDYIYDALQDSDYEYFKY